MKDLDNFSEQYANAFEKLGIKVIDDNGNIVSKDSLISDLFFDQLPFNHTLAECIETKLGKVYDALISLGVTTIKDLSLVQQDKFLQLKGMTLNKWEKVVEFREEVYEKRHNIIDYFNYCIKNYEFPILEKDIDVYSFEELSTICMNQLLSHIEKGSHYNKNYKKLLDCVFRCNVGQVVR